MCWYEIILLGNRGKRVLIYLPRVVPQCRVAGNLTNKPTVSSCKYSTLLWYWGTQVNTPVKNWRDKWLYCAVIDVLIEARFVKRNIELHQMLQIVKIDKQLLTTVFQLSALLSATFSGLLEPFERKNFTRWKMFSQPVWCSHNSPCHMTSTLTTIIRSLK